MKKIALVVLLAIGASAFGQPIPKMVKSPVELVPPGYVVVQEIQGDLNKDNQADHVLIIKGTNKDRFIEDEQRGRLDRNRRGIIIALQNNGRYELAMENRNCFSSENEDGGVYFAPELHVSISKGNLQVHYAHGRYGYWTYSFRYRNFDFELIGYEGSVNNGPVIDKMVSINFMTKKVRTRKNINPDAEAGEEKFKESWTEFLLSKPIRLREIADFDNLDVNGFLESVK